MAGWPSGSAEQGSVGISWLMTLYVSKSHVLMEVVETTWRKKF